LSLIDVGSGAGLPGMVLAIARPHWRVTMLDSLRKRCNFIDEAASRIGLGNAKALWARAEDAGRDEEHREVRHRGWPAVQ
jgi:16S rRNA (guanine527-N7)-methyltransferase